MNVLAVNDALKVLQALGNAILVVDDSGRVTAAIGCSPDFQNLSERTGFGVLRPYLSSAIALGENADLDLSLPAAPAFLQVRRQRVRIIGLGGHAAICLDPSDSKREANATEQLREYEFVVRNIRQGIWRLDASGRILFVNPYLAAWLESTPDRLLGRNIREFLPDGRLDHERVAGIDRFESEFVTESGLHRRSIVVSSPIEDAKGRETGRVELVTDITAEHAVQSRLVQEVQRMAQLASLDPLTNLLNRRAFDLTLQNLASEASARPFGLILLDIDSLKDINDRFGHEAGDLAITAFSDRLLASVRDNDRVSRLGGDEFAVLVPGVDPGTLAEIADRLHRGLQQELELPAGVVTVGASVGWAHSQDGIESLMRHADRSLYQNKRDKKA